MRQKLSNLDKSQHKYPNGKTIGVLVLAFFEIGHFCRTSLLETLNGELRNLSYRVVDGGQGGS